MRVKDLFYEAINALTSNKARTGLTMLGIIIGISSVIAMISVGQGTQTSVEESIQSLGSNLLTVSPRRAGFGSGSSTGGTLTMDDVEIIEGLELVETVAPYVSSNAQVNYKGAGTATSIYGVSPNYQTVRDVSVAQGTFISVRNVSSYNKVAVIGPTIVEELFGEGYDPVGEKIKIKDITFTVIGVTVSEGQQGFTNTDAIIYIPISTAQRYLTGDDSVSSISVQVVSEEAMDQAEQELTLALLTAHNIADESLADFQVMNQADLVDTIGQVTGVFTILLASIAAISLLVGGIGIMNMMLTTVTERTKEIGLRKAIGAKRGDITVQFLTEAVLLTFIGGGFGVGFGVVLARVIAIVGDMTTTISMEAIILAFGVSALIGLVFGYYPAQRAAKLDPIDALRYE